MNRAGAGSGGTSPLQPLARGGLKATSVSRARTNAAKKKPTPKANKRNADDRVRKLVVARGQCERCGSMSGPFEHAHIIRRRYSWTRTDERNGWCLCRDCHFTVDNNALAFSLLVEKTIGTDVFADLYAKSQQRDKFDWAAEVARLKALA